MRHGREEKAAAAPGREYLAGGGGGRAELQGLAPGGRGGLLLRRPTPSHTDGTGEKPVRERPVDAGRKRQQEVLWGEEGAKEDEGARGWTRGVLLAVAVARAASPLRRAGCGRQGGRDQRGVRGMQRHRRGLDVMGLCGVSAEAACARDPGPGGRCWRGHLGPDDFARWEVGSPGAEQSLKERSVLNEQRNNNV